jgi:hypothetical protein
MPLKPGFCYIRYRSLGKAADICAALNLRLVVCIPMGLVGSSLQLIPEPRYVPRVNAMMRQLGSEVYDKCPGDV